MAKNRRVPENASSRCPRQCQASRLIEFARGLCFPELNVAAPDDAWCRVVAKVHAPLLACVHARKCRMIRKPFDVEHILPGHPPERSGVAGFNRRTHPGEEVRLLVRAGRKEIAVVLLTRADRGRGLEDALSGSTCGDGGSRHDE